jgi:ABC-type bacteriocin/lantibiotic exporter with double-glycine peptidase domain
MQLNEGRPRLGYRGSVSSRARDIILKTVAVVAGGVVLTSAFVLSLAFFAIVFAVVLVFGGYLWWKTRDLRKQLRAQMQGQMHTQQPQGDVIEGVVISRSQAHQDRPHPR